jgi:hypothetical protein
LNKPLFHITLFLVLMILPQIKGFAQKTDTIVHVNGNILKGDFKKLQFAVVTWKMIGMGTISLEEPYIKTIISKKQFEIKMKSGLIYYSSFSAANSGRSTYIMVDGQKKLINIDDIVEAYTIKSNLWMRLSGKMSLGANYQKSSDVSSLSLSGNLDYRKAKTYFQLNWNVNLSYQGDSVTTNNSDINIAWQRLFKKQWSTMVAFGTSQNLQLGIKRRYNVSLGGVKDITYNNWNRLYAGGALSGINETPYDDFEVSTDLGGLIQLGWQVYKFTSPKIQVDTNISYIPYITGDSRSRVNANINPSISILNSNFKVGFSFYYNYDSNPPAGSFGNVDLGVNLQLSYVLH